LTAVVAVAARTDALATVVAARAAAFAACTTGKIEILNESGSGAVFSIFV